MTNWWPDTCSCGFTLDGGQMVAALRKCDLHAVMPDAVAFEAVKLQNQSMPDDVVI